MKMNFEDYGTLEWLEPEDYYTGDWTYRGTAEGADGEQYDIVFSRRRQEFRFTTV